MRWRRSERRRAVHGMCKAYNNASRINDFCRDDSTAQMTDVDRRCEIQNASRWERVHSTVTAHIRGNGASEVPDCGLDH